MVQDAVEVVDVAGLSAPQVAEPPLLTVIETLPVGDADALLTVTVEMAVWP